MSANESATTLPEGSIHVRCARVVISHAGQLSLEKAKIRRLQIAQREALIRPGELLTEQVRKPGQRDEIFPEGTFAPPTLEDQGISGKLSHRAQLAAKWVQAEPEAFWQRRRLPIAVALPSPYLR